VKVWSPKSDFIFSFTLSLLSDTFLAAAIVVIGITPMAEERSIVPIYLLVLPARLLAFDAERGGLAYT
jgi:hypothetical protein